MLRASFGATLRAPRSACDSCRRHCRSLCVVCRPTHAHYSRGFSLFVRLARTTNCKKKKNIFKALCLCLCCCRNRTNVRVLSACSAFDSAVSSSTRCMRTSERLNDTKYERTTNDSTDQKTNKMAIVSIEHLLFEFEYALLQIGDFLFDTT
jgi:hypothetical protein